MHDHSDLNVKLPYFHSSASIMATPGQANPQLPKVSLLKEGYLLKRQRGQRPGADLRGLRFQQRFICLTQDYLDYYVDKKKGEKKGEFPVTQMRIVEKVPDNTFQKTFCFQMGDEKEMMYFKAKSESERKEWIEALRIAATLKGNVMLDNYHTGAYGQVHQLKWSCCNAANRDTPGCQQTSTNSSKQPRRMTSLIESHSSSETVARRPFISLRGHHSKPQQRQQQQHQRSPSPVFHDAREAPEDALQQTSGSLATCAISPLSKVEQEGSSAEILGKLMHQDYRGDSMDGKGMATVDDSHMLQSVNGNMYDSGLFLDSSSQFTGSQQSIISGPLSPPVHHKGNDSRRIGSLPPKLEEAVPESELHKEIRDQKGSQSWKCWEILTLNPQSEVISIVFRRTDTLVAAHEDGSVKVFNIAKTGAAGLKNSYTHISTIGSIDIWKNYLALGLPELKLVNLDNNRTLHRPTEDRVYPHLVAFTPRGNLLSYNQSQPDMIKTWPKVELSWSSLDIESESLLDINDDYIDSILVSPNPSQPWFAVSTANTRQVQVYNYESHKLKYLLDADYEKAVVSFAPNGRYIAIARGRSLAVHDIESNASIFHFPELDVPVTSLAYNPWPRDTHLAIGLNNGDIKVYSGLLNLTPELVMSLSDRSKSKASRSVTSLAYSVDGLTLAAGSSSGKLKLWKVHKPSKSENEGASLVREGEMTVDSNGNQYVSPDDGYVILVPPEAIAEGKTVTFKHGVVPDGPFGPFEFPDGVRPVSAILSLHPTTEEPLLKPIEIAQPHFIHCETQEDQKRLAVYKADCRGHIKCGKMVYSFKRMTDVKLCLGNYYGDPNYPQGIPYAKYSTSHCCHLCIGEYGEDDTDRAIFSLFDIKPKTLGPFEDPIVRFCLPYFLPTCHKTIREQYPEEAYDLGIQSVKFSSSVDNPAISIHFEERLGSWILSLQGGNEKKIYRQEVCFWDYPTASYLEEMCKEKLYPPRFNVLVRGPVRPDDTVKAEFTFSGAEVFPGRGQPVAVVNLPLKAQQCLSTGPTSSSIRSRISSEQSNASEVAPLRLVVPQGNHLNSPSGLQSVARAFKACMFDLDELHPSKLAVNLFSKDLIDEAFFANIQESVKSTTKDELVTINAEILRKVYNNLKTDARLYTPLHEVLKKLHPDSARKFASETSRLSREGSTTSNFSYSTTQERLSNEAEPPPDEVFPNSVCVANGSSTPTSQHTLYVPIQNDGENLMAFCSQMSHSPAEPRSVETETAERTPSHAALMPSSD